MMVSGSDGFKMRSDNVMEDRNLQYTEQEILGSLMEGKMKLSGTAFRLPRHPGHPYLK